MSDEDQGAPWVREESITTLACTYMIESDRMCGATGTVHQGHPDARNYTGHSRCDAHAPDEVKT